MKRLFPFAFILLISCSTQQKLIQAKQSEVAHAESTSAWLYDNYGVINDPQLSELLHRITKRISSSLHVAIYSFNSSYAQSVAVDTNYNWQVLALNSQEASVFSVGNGTIFVTGGLIEAANSESELAAVLAHEMAHQALGHTTNAFLQANEHPNSAISFFGQQEEAADFFSLHILQSAHYNPQAALAAINISNRADSSKVSEQDEFFFQQRRAMLASMLATLPTSIGVTDSTRDFAKVRQKLLRGK